MFGKIIIYDYGFYMIYTLIQMLINLTTFFVLHDKPVREGSFQEKLRMTLLYWTGAVITILMFDFGRSLVNVTIFRFQISFTLWYVETGVCVGYYIVMLVVFSSWKILWDEDALIKLLKGDDN